MHCFSLASCANKNCICEMHYRLLPGLELARNAICQHVRRRLTSTIKTIPSLNRNQGAATFYQPDIPCVGHFNNLLFHWLGIWLMGHFSDWFSQQVISSNGHFKNESSGNLFITQQDILLIRHFMSQQFYSSVNW
jgi:hypothetical protein